MPLAFEFGLDSRKKDSAFRAELIHRGQQSGVMDFLFDTVKSFCDTGSDNNSGLVSFTV